MEKISEKSLRILVPVVIIVSIFIYVVFTTKDTFEVQNAHENIVEEVDLEKREIEQKPTLLRGFEEVEDSEVESELNVSEEKPSYELLKEVNNSSDTIGNSSVLTLNFNITKAGKYLVKLPSIIYSSYALRWGSGEISMGDSSSSVKKIQPELDEGETLRGFVSNLVYTESKDIYLEVGSPTTLAVDLINTETSAKVSQPMEIQNADSGAKYSSLDIISRDIWGATPGNWDPNSSLDIDDPGRYVWEPGYFRVSRFVIHHTASPNNAIAPAQAVRDIYLYHAYSRGWGDIGYNYLIDAWGNIYEGKGGGDEVYGYHAYSEANAMSIGIALIGDFTSGHPTYAAKQSLTRLLAEKAAFYDIKLSLSDGSLNDWLNENTTVFGHKDSFFWCHPGHPMAYLCTDKDKWVVNNTACPGQNLSTVLSSEIVSDARNYKDYNFYELKSVVSKVNDLIDGAKDEVNWIYVKYDLPESTDPSVIEDMLPIFSGLINYEIHGNEVILHLGGWNEGIPSYGWDGFYEPGTFFPASEGKNDRAKTLMKVFEMDPDVEEVAPYNRFSVSPIE